MKEDRSNYESMSLHSRRGFFQSLIALAAVVALPVPIGIVLGRGPTIINTGWHLREIYIDYNYLTEEYATSEFVDGVLVDGDGSIFDGHIIVERRWSRDERRSFQV